MLLQVGVLLSVGTPFISICSFLWLQHLYSNLVGCVKVSFDDLVVQDWYLRWYLRVWRISCCFCPEHSFLCLASFLNVGFSRADHCFSCGMPKKTSVDWTGVKIFTLIFCSAHCWCLGRNWCQHAGPTSPMIISSDRPLPCGRSRKRCYLGLCRDLSWMHCLRRSSCFLRRVRVHVRCSCILRGLHFFLARSL